MQKEASSHDRGKPHVSEFDRIVRDSLARLKQLTFAPGAEYELCVVGGHNRSIPTPLRLREFGPNEHVLTIVLEAKGVKYMAWTWYNAPLATVGRTPREALVKMHSELKKAIDRRKLSGKGGT